MKQNELIKKIIEYYSSYYKDDLGLSDWKNHVNQRLNEEKVELEKIEKLEKLLYGVENKKILNVGCGTGGFSIVAHKKKASVFAIEPDREAYAISLLKAKKVGIPLSRIKQAEAEKIPFPSNYFDIVYCYSVIEHVKNVEDSLKEMLRVLKSRGFLYIESRDYRSFYEGHYKIFWLPLFPKNIAKYYLKIRKKNPNYLFRGITYVTLPQIKKIILKIAPMAEITDLIDKPGRQKGLINFFIWVYYKLTKINPDIELLIKKP